MQMHDDIVRTNSPTPPAPTPLAAEFEERGFIGPIPILPAKEAAALCRVLQSEPEPDIPKGSAAVSAAFYGIGTHPAILDRVAELIGDDVMLWGASLVARAPGRVHPWHTDIETAGDVGRTVSVWLGLENVNRNSSLQVIPGSHAFGVTIQELAKEAGKGRGEVPPDVVVQWSRARREDAELFAADMGNGDAIFFDGRLWHGTDNTNARGKRVALLLQYATPDRPMRYPDYKHLEAPFVYLDEPRPACIMVRGTDRYGVNQIVPPPSGSGTSGSWTRALELPLEADPDSGWKIHRISSGPTGRMEKLSCHASVLSKGAQPHPPHQHEEEEILVVLDGEAVLTIGDGVAGSSREERVGPGAVAYYPAWQFHTIRNDSDLPVTYLMFKWRNPAPDDPAPADAQAPTLRTALHHAPEHAGAANVSGWSKGLVMEGRTDHLRKLHMHLSSLEPGAGYEPHADGYDVAILVLDGEVETLGARLGRGGVAFYAAGEPHGIRNVGEGTATYLVVEFHGDGAPAVRNEQSRPMFVTQLARAVPAPAKRLMRKGLRLLR